jgi:hypothetical protein
MDREHLNKSDPDIMDNQGIHVKNMRFAPPIAAVAIFLWQYLSSHFLWQSVFEGCAAFITSWLSILFYRWVWPKKSAPNDEDFSSH